MASVPDAHTRSSIEVRAMAFFEYNEPRQRGDQIGRHAGAVVWAGKPFCAGGETFV